MATVHDECAGSPGRAVSSGTESPAGSCRGRGGRGEYSEADQKGSLDLAHAVERQRAAQRSGVQEGRIEARDLLAFHDRRVGEPTFPSIEEHMGGRRPDVR